MRRQARDRRGGSRAVAPRGFSLIELVTVVAVAVLLAGLLLPSLSNVRENVNRVMCSSHQRQIGMAIMMFARSEGDKLPESQLLRDRMYSEMMAVATGDGARAGEQRADWDGLGMLYANGFCDTPHIYYCPSHMGEHTVQRYEHEWLGAGQDRIFSNYHYLGDKDWKDGTRRRLHQGDPLILVTDGLRSVQDFNHQTGLNMLFGDGSVRWFEDGGENSVAATIAHAHDHDAADDWVAIWDSLHDLIQ